MNVSATIVPVTFVLFPEEDTGEGNDGEGATQGGGQGCMVGAGLPDDPMVEAGGVGHHPRGGGEEEEDDEAVGTTDDDEDGGAGARRGWGAGSRQRVAPTVGAAAGSGRRGWGAAAGFVAEEAAPVPSAAGTGGAGVAEPLWGRAPQSGRRRRREDDDSSYDNAVEDDGEGSQEF